MVLPIKEYERLRDMAVPAYHLKGKTAVLGEVA